MKFPLRIKKVMQYAKVDGIMCVIVFSMQPRMDEVPSLGDEVPGVVAVLCYG